MFNLPKDIPAPYVGRGCQARIVSDKKALREKSGIRFDGYDFKEGQTIVIPDLPWEKQTFMEVQTREGSKNWVTLLSVVIDGEKPRRSWLRLSALTKQSFVDREFPDEARRILATEYPDDYERLEALRGAKIHGDGPVPFKRYAFEDGKVKLDDDGNKVVDEDATETVGISIEWKAADAE